MFPRTVLAATLIAWALGPAAQAEPAAGASAGDRFHALLDEHWAAARAEKIFFRTDPDAWRMDGTLPDHSAEARERRARFNAQVLARLADIDPAGLSARDRLSYRVFAYERQTERDTYLQPEHYFPFTSLFGYHTYFAEAPANASFLSAADYDDYLVSLADFTRYNRTFIGILREAVARGYTHYCGSIGDYGESMRAHIVDRAEQSRLYVPFTRFPGSMTAAQRAHYTAKGVQLINDVIVPGFAELHEFFVSEYLPACRTAVSVATLPDGAAYYQNRIEYYTTTDLDAGEIHALGVAELKRIRAEMQAIIDRVGFDGDFKSFVDFLRDDPRFYASTDLELLGRAALICKTAEGELPKFFTLLPRATYKIVGDPNRGGFYVAPSGDGTDSGSFFIKTGDLRSEPLYSLEALALHEGVPGHHLQSALAQELDLPAFRRDLNHSGFGEGWALYSERLGIEMGFYRDPYSEFGRLSYEAWRAVRLIVDTGMHAFGWSRQQSVDFMLANTSASAADVNSEVDRYITWPAQALSYKIGELKIRELRTRAEEALGTSFDIRRFHDIVVGNGSLPLAVLEDMVNEWIVAERALTEQITR